MVVAITATEKERAHQPPHNGFIMLGRGLLHDNLSYSSRSLSRCFPMALFEGEIIYEIYQTGKKVAFMC